MMLAMGRFSLVVPQVTHVFVVHECERRSRAQRSTPCGRWIGQVPTSKSATAELQP
jgi:hypothetical protein